MNPEEIDTLALDIANAESDEPGWFHKTERQQIAEAVRRIPNLPEDRQEHEQIGLVRYVTDSWAFTTSPLGERLGHYLEWLRAKERKEEQV